ncbi:MAG: hypothetical protein NVSMB56_07200 [Pyrinomonadaceae bacterium]
MDREARELTGVLLVIFILLVFAVICVIIFFRVMWKENKMEQARKNAIEKKPE